MRFTSSLPALLLCVAFTAEVHAALPNAWQITDISTAAGSTLGYTNQLSASDRFAATNGGFRFAVNARFVTSYGGSKTITLLYGLGARRFLIWWNVDGNGDLTAELEGGSTYTLTTNGTGTEEYHTHEIIYNPATGTANYVFDGVVKTDTWPSSAVPYPAGRMAWGAGSSGGQGQMNFNTVTFEVTNTVVASYDAGAEGNPAMSPDPTTQGWTLDPPAPPAGTSVEGISADIPTFVLQNIPGLPTIRFGSTDWSDYDNDGRLDFLITGFYANSPQFNGPISQLWRNTGSGFTNVPNPGPQGVYFSSVAWGDYDNDGRLDFLLTGDAAGIPVSQLWRNTGSGFTIVSISDLPGVRNGSVVWGDFDNDGRLDFLLTGREAAGNLVSQLWRNTGLGFSYVPISGLPGVEGGSVAWGDYDNDGQLDFLLTGTTISNNISQLWRNTGSGFTNVPIPGLPEVSGGSVAWGDYDNDGWLDFLLTGETATFSTSFSQLWRNTGSGFTNVPIPGLPGVAGTSSVVWGDFDNDGRLDFLLTGSTTNLVNVNISQLWRNTGSGFIRIPIPLPQVSRSSVGCGDYDNDGRLDLLFTGGISSLSTDFCQVWRNVLPASNAPPAAPTGLAVTTAQPFVILTWNAATDDYTPPDGLTYNVRIGTTPGGSNVVSPMALGSGWRLLPQIGNAQSGLTARFHLPFGPVYYWSVQAVDSAFAGSSFAAEQQFGGFPLGDSNGDGVVDQAEFNSVLSNYWLTSPPDMESVVSPNSAVFQFSLGNLESLNFQVLATTNVALPLEDWENIGPAALRYQFSDPDATNFPQRFYQLVWP